MCPGSSFDQGGGCPKRQASPLCTVSGPAEGAGLCERERKGEGVTAGSRGSAPGRPWDVVSRRLHARQRWCGEASTRHCPPWSVNVVTHSPEPPAVAAPQPRCRGPCPGPALVQEERDGPAPLAAAPVLKHAAPSWVSEAGSPPLGGTPGGFPVPMHVARLAQGAWAASSLHTPAFHNLGNKPASRAGTCPSPTR